MRVWHDRDSVRTVSTHLNSGGFEATLAEWAQAMLAEEGAMEPEQFVVHVDRFCGVSGAPAGTSGDERVLQQLLGSLAQDVQVTASSQVDYIKFLLCLVFLRSCAPQDWPELQNFVISGAKDVTLSEVIRRVGHLVDKTLCTRGLLPDMAAQLERLRLRSASSLVEVIRIVDRLGPDAFDPLLDRFEAEAQLSSADFFTPREVASLMVNLAVGEASMAHPIYDPYLRGGELLKAVDSVQFGPRQQLVVGESPNQDTLRLAAMNLALRGLAAELRLGTGTPWDDLDEWRPLFGAVVLNPPFNLRGPSTRLRRDSEWPFGPPPSHSDNYAWIQYAITSLAPGGTAAVLMPNRAGVSANEREYAIRRKMVEQGAVQAVVALPSQLFQFTEIGATLWVVARPASAPGQVLFIDARAMSCKTRKRQTLVPHAAELICGVYQRRQLLAEGSLEPVAGGGMAVLAGIDVLRRANYSLSPADYTTGSIKPQPGASAARVAESLHDLAHMRSRVYEADYWADELRPRPRGPFSGDLPRGWRRCPLADLCDIQAGPSYSRLGMEERAESGTVPIVMPRHLRDRQVIAPDADRVSDEVAWQLARFRLAANDVLCIRSGAMGEPALVSHQQEGWLFGTNLLRLRVGDLDTADPGYMLGYLSLPAVMRWVRDRSRGTATPSISARSLGDLMVALPPLAEQHEIGSALLVFDQQIAAHREFVQTAEKVRAELAEHLMDGALILR